MKRINEGKVLLVKAKKEVKKQDRRRLKRLVERHSKKLAGISAAPAAASPE